jgi:hypothetical protein
MQKWGVIWVFQCFYWLQILNLCYKFSIYVTKIEFCSTVTNLELARIFLPTAEVKYKQKQKFIFKTPSIA